MRTVSVVKTASKLCFKSEGLGIWYDLVWGVKRSKHRETARNNRNDVEKTAWVKKLPRWLTNHKRNKKRSSRRASTMKHRDETNTTRECNFCCTGAGPGQGVEDEWWPDLIAADQLDNAKSVTSQISSILISGRMVSESSQGHKLSNLPVSILDHAKKACL